MSGCVVLTYPVHVSRHQAFDFLHQHNQWICDTLASIPPPPDWTGGGHVMIEGKAVPVLHEPDRRTGCALSDKGLHVSGQTDFTARRVKDFLRHLARNALPANVIRQAVRMNAHVTKIDLRDVRSRWGSCSRSGRIMLSWRLVMCPAYVRDYVIIHELSHLEHFDHSPAFWDRVEHFCDNGHTGRLAAERWLRQNGLALLRIV